MLWRDGREESIISLKGVFWGWWLRSDHFLFGTLASVASNSGLWVAIWFWCARPHFSWNFISGIADGILGLVRSFSPVWWRRGLNSQSLLPSGHIYTLVTSQLLLKWLSLSRKVLGTVLPWQGEVGTQGLRGCVCVDGQPRNQVLNTAARVFCVLFYNHSSSSLTLIVPKEEAYCRLKRTLMGIEDHALVPWSSTSVQHRVAQGRLEHIWAPLNGTQKAFGYSYFLSAADRS